MTNANETKISRQEKEAARCDRRIQAALDRLGRLSKDLQKKGNKMDFGWADVAALQGFAAALERITHEDDGESLFPGLVDDLPKMSVRGL